MGKIITVFSHKGGVGKTTLVHNIGYILANKGLKVLLVDADPQMNLTAAVAGFTDSVSYSESGSAQWLQFLSNYPNLSSLLYLAANGKKVDLNFYSTTRIYEYKQKHNANALGRKSIKPGDSIKFNDGGSVDLLSSSLGFSYVMQGEAPTSLPQMEFNLCNLVMNKTNSLMSGAMFNIHKAIRKLKDSYDYILIDTPPSGGSMLNGVLFFSSDYFIVPVKPDFFSLQAIDGLYDVIKNWRECLQSWCKTAMQDGFDFPTFLGVAPQMTKRFDVDGSRNAAHVKLWDGKINSSIIKFLKQYVFFTECTDIQKAEEWFKFLFPESTPYIMRECCHFTGKLRDVAERAAIPVVFLNNAICDEMGATGLYVETSKEDDVNQWYLAYRSILAEYTYIADGLLRIDDANRNLNLTV